MKQRTPKFLIFMTIFIDLLGFGIVIPILPAISAQYLRPGDWGEGAAILMTVFSLLQMMFSPVWGGLSDRHGRRPILLLSLFGSTASYLIFALTPNFTVLLISRVFAGICGANITAAQAYIADITDEKDRTAGMGLVGMAFGLGFALGPVIGGAAAHLAHACFPTAPPQWGPGIAATLICGINWVATYARLPESLPPDRRGASHFHRFASLREAASTLRRPSLGPLIVLFFLATFAFANLEVSFSLYAKRVLGYDEEGIYRVFIYIGVVMAIVQGWLVRKAVRKIPEATLMIAGTATVMVGLALLPMGTSLPVLLGSLAILSLGQGVCNPSVLSLISRQAEGGGAAGAAASDLGGASGGEPRSGQASAQGNVLGTSQAASSLARIVGPAFGGIIYDKLGPRWPFWAAAVVMAGATLWAAHARARLRRHAPQLTMIAPHAVKTKRGQDDKP